MSYGIQLNAGSGGANLATDEITNGTLTGTYHYQVVKVAFSALNSETWVHSSVGAALPVSILGNLSVTASIAGGSLTVTQSTASNLKVDLSGTGANSTPLNVSLTGPVSITGALPTSLSGPVSVVGTVEVSVKGPVSITGTITTFTSLSGPVSIIGTADVSIKGPVSITNGTVTANAGSGTFQVSIVSGVSILNGTITANAGSGTFQVSVVGPVSVLAHDVSVKGPVSITGTVPVSLMGPVSIVGTLAASLSGPVSLAAGTNLVGIAIAPVPTGAGALYSGTTALTPKTTCVRASASGDNVVVLSVTSKQVRVLAMALVANTTVSAYIVDVSASGTPLMGAATCPITIWPSGGFILPFNPAGWFDTTSARNLVLNLSGANQVAGTITYVEI